MGKPNPTKRQSHLQCRVLVLRTRDTCSINFLLFLPIFSQAAVRYDGPQEGEEVAEHGKGMVDGRGAVLIEQELVMKKEYQDSCRGRDGERKREREIDKRGLIMLITKDTSIM